MTQRSGALLLAAGALRICRLRQRRRHRLTPRSSRTQATVDVKAFVDSQVQRLVQASQGPPSRQRPASLDADGWNAEDDADAYDGHGRERGGKPRAAYENVEGPIAALFEGARCLRPTRATTPSSKKTEQTSNLFDDKDVTGMHAIERILFSDSTPDYVVKFEMDALTDDYKAAAFPKTEAEADAFKNKLAEARWSTTER